MGCEAVEGTHQVHCQKWVPARPLYLETPKHVPNILCNRTGDEITPYEEMESEKEGQNMEAPQSSFYLHNSTNQQ